MKKIAAFLVCLALSLSLSACGEKGKLEKAMELIGKESYAEAYEILSAMPDYEGVGSLLGKFTRVEKTVRKVDFSESGEIFCKYYDGRGKIVKEVNGNNAETVNYVYDDSDLVEKNYLPEEGESKTEKYFYDDAGRCIEKHTERSDGKNSTDYYTYDEKGNVITKVTKKDDGSEICYEYSYEGARRTKAVLTSGGEKVYEAKYSYDNRGRRIKEEIRYPEGDMDVYSYSYDKHGNRIKSTTDFADGSYAEVRYTYDDRGRVLTERHEYTHGAVQNYSYEYEEQFVYTE